MKGKDTWGRKRDILTTSTEVENFSNEVGMEREFGGNKERKRLCNDFGSEIKKR